ncbi:MAG: outer membrane beta-barrel protein [Bacillota bacterium]
MKRVLLIFFVLSFCANSIVFAQDEVRPDFSNRRTALLFTFSGLANLGAGDFEGGIGGKLFFSPNLALRAGLSFARASETNPFQNNNNTPGQDEEKTATGFGINAALEYHVLTTRVSPYMGVGVGLSTLSTESKNAVAANANQTTIKNNRQGETIGGQNYLAGTTVSVFALIGAEFFLYKELSLAAEYRIGFSSTSRSDQEVSVANQTTTTSQGSVSRIGIDNQGFLTLAFYF